jgi:hypothetical protein
MARNPSDPNRDGGAYVSVLTDYVDWNYASPPSKPKEPRTPPTPERRGEEWARWVKTLLMEALDEEVANETDPSRKGALASARKHIQGKWSDT